jgi:hypothetical protein
MPKWLCFDAYEESILSSSESAAPRSVAGSTVVFKYVVTEYKHSLIWLHTKEGQNIQSSPKKTFVENRM